MRGRGGEEGRRGWGMRRVREEGRRRGEELRREGEEHKRRGAEVKRSKGKKEVRR